jgi:hypothetical protein
MMKERKSRNNSKKRILAVLCTLTLAVGQMSAVSAGELAEEEPESDFADSAENVTETTDAEAYGEYIYQDAEALADNEELFAGYAQKMLYPTKTRKIARSTYYGETRLSGMNLAIYKALKEEIKQVAAGTKDSTIFNITYTNSWTKDDLGVILITTQ